MRILLALVLVWSLPAFGRDRKPAAEGSANEGQFVFQLFPRSVQSRPKFDIWIFTELSPLGKPMAGPTAEAPCYYLSESGGYHSFGEFEMTRFPTAQALTRVLSTMLSGQGYLPADDSHPAGVLLVYTWGSHNRERERQADRQLFAAPSTNEPYAGSHEDMVALTRNMRKDTSYSDSGIAVSGPQVSAAQWPARATDESRSLDRMPNRDWIPYAWSTERPAPMRKSEQVERAALLAGESFAREFERTVERLPEDDGPAGPAISTLASMAEAHPRGSFLLRSINQSLFFVVVTAYDTRSLALGRREVLWRTKIAMPADGVSMVDGVPAMLVAGAPYLGRATGSGVLLQREVDRRGGVVIGQPEVVSWEPGAEKSRTK